MYKWKLKACRVQAGYSQKEVGAELHVTEQTIVSWENGKTTPNMDQGKALSELYGIPLEVMDFSKIGNQVIKN